MIPASVLSEGAGLARIFGSMERPRRSGSSSTELPVCSRKYIFRFHARVMLHSMSKKVRQFQQIIKSFTKCPKKIPKPISMLPPSPTAKLLNKNSPNSREDMISGSSTLLLTLLKLAIWSCWRRSRAKLLYYSWFCQCLRCLSRLLLQQCVART